MSNHTIYALRQNVDNWQQMLWVGYIPINDKYHAPTEEKKENILLGVSAEKPRCVHFDVITFQLTDNIEHKWVETTECLCVRVNNLT